MKIAYFDMFSGISGDMTLGALVDLGVPVDHLQKELSKMLPGFELKARQVLKSHLRATDIVVDVTAKEGVSRNYTDIKAMIENAPLSESVKNNSLKAFEKIARAEAHIHNKDIEKVHFHEIGGVDSIVDIIGSFIAIEYLGIEKVYGSIVPLGSGFIECAHGRIPVPVPATLAILQDIPVTNSDAKTEIVTPTGAALISTLGESFGPMPAMAVKKTGYGSGKRDTGAKLPNLMRVVLGDAVDETGDDIISKETICVAKTNIDDMNPEAIGFLMESLFKQNALDVTYVPVHMKKNRPGTQVEVICRKEDLGSIVELILSETTSIGVRHHECQRSYLSREKVDLETRFGNVQVKKIIRPASDNGGKIEYVPEYEVAAGIAKENNMALKDVYNQILSDANSLDRE